MRASSILRNKVREREWMDFVGLILVYALEYVGGNAGVGRQVCLYCYAKPKVKIRFELFTLIMYQDSPAE